MKTKTLLILTTLIAMAGCGNSDDTAKVEKPATSTKLINESVTKAVEPVKEITKEEAAEDTSKEALEQADEKRPQVVEEVKESADTAVENAAKAADATKETADKAKDASPSAIDSVKESTPKVIEVIKPDTEDAAQ
ncbi:hypothetical protein [Methylotuvimicrobium buryatense]|uniref:Uncharacterized protein n=1 Tax=Methylotuvimicrobium buryatense TaxID=95641 RepID=A0A4P9URB8_METBY|nr:hypothetical protein [Methylotuvimicrobium buryatense]QCW83937.1 hypothetical protein EQU24_18090 [Methylotuvimicrobium buryatense]